MSKAETSSLSSRAATAAPSHAQAWQAFVAYLSLWRVGLALGLATFAALLLSPIFITPFPVLLGRTMCVGLLGLLAFAAVGQWPRRLPRWLARWLLQVLVVTLTVPHVLC
eukprot:Opistho-1_new@62845